eukprot:Lithocolla_globosa_v1_NODE_585_length_3676_cov_22.132560.p4 type:complete len:106 gc:universal NODE_585_length_3676_cov_22.132560:3232-3549(+)
MNHPLNNTSYHYTALIKNSLDYSSNDPQEHLQNHSFNNTNYSTSTTSTSYKWHAKCIPSSTHQTNCSTDHNTTINNRHPPTLHKIINKTSTIHPKPIQLLKNTTI